MNKDKDKEFAAYTKKLESMKSDEIIVELQKLNIGIGYKLALIDISRQGWEGLKSAMALNSNYIGDRVADFHKHKKTTHHGGT
jgi:hypothetical protein